MARFLSDDWVAEVNRGLSDLDASALDATASIVAASGSYSVLQIVRDVPDAGGDVGLVLIVDEAGLRLERVEDPVGSGTTATVTISLSADDAAALHQGVFDPAAALSAGAVRVRGDLSVLVASQGVFRAASARLADLGASTTY